MKLQRRVKRLRSKLAGLLRAKLDLQREVVLVTELAREVDAELRRIEPAAEDQKIAELKEGRHAHERQAG